MKKTQTLSLQEQLLKSGLATDAKAKQVKAEKRKQTKQQRNNGIEIIDPLKIEIEQARQQQVERDRELNHLRKQVEEQKALMAQIRQIVLLNRIAKDESGVVYQFNDEGKVKGVYVSSKVREALIDGRAGIVKLDGGYELVPAEVARKIQDRHADSVIVLNTNIGSTVAAEDDPYASYQIPDDLMW